MKTISSVSLISVVVLIGQPCGAADHPDNQKAARTSVLASYDPLLKQLQQYVREGNEIAAKSVIEKLGKKTPPAEPKEKTELSEVANFLIAKERWSLAKLYLERLPQSEFDDGGKARLAVENRHGGSEIR